MDRAEAALPRGGEVHVWVAATAGLESSGDLRACAALLSAEEQARLCRFAFESDRRSFLAAHALLRLALTRSQPLVAAAEWEFRRGRHGRPEVAGPPQGEGLRVSLSHTRAWVACVVTDGLDCGIDVERVHDLDDLETLAVRVMTPEEVRQLRSMSPEDRPRQFTEAWTLKEALAKALGHGLHLPFDKVGFSTGPPGVRLTAPSVLDHDDENGHWLFEQWAVDTNHLAALAVRRSAAAARVIRHSAPPPLGRPTA